MNHIKKILIVLAIWLLTQVLASIPHSVGVILEKEDLLALLFAAGLLASQLLEIVLFWIFKFFKPSNIVKPSTEPIVLLVSLPLGFSFLYAVNLLSLPFDIPDLMSKEIKELSNYITGFLALAIVGPISEEILLRHIILNEIKEATGKVWASILISAAIFAVIHVNPIQVVFAFPAGILLGWLYCKTGSLLVPICVHILNNTFAFVTLRMGEENPSSFMSSEVLVPLALCIVVATALIMWMNNHYKKSSNAL